MRPSGPAAALSPCPSRHAAGRAVCRGGGGECAVAWPCWGKAATGASRRSPRASAAADGVRKTQVQPSPPPRSGMARPYSRGPASGARPADRAAAPDVRRQPQGRRRLVGPCVVKLRWANVVRTPAPAGGAAGGAAAGGTSIEAFIGDLPEHLAGVKLPMGAKVTRVGSDAVVLDFPKLQLLDVWVEPHVRADVSRAPGCVEARATTAGCVLSGSHHVEALQLNERFDLDACVRFSWADGAPDVRGGRAPVLITDSRIDVQVDVPLPFSLLPTSTLEATADAALAVVLPVLRDAFVRNLVARYAPWASAQRAKAARAAAAAADATSAAVATSDGASEHSDANG